MEVRLTGRSKESEQRGNLLTKHGSSGSHKGPGGTRMSRAGRIMRHPTMSGGDIVACFIGAFLGLVAAALLVAFLG